MLTNSLSVLCWLIRDTFRQSLASSAFWLLLAVSGLCIVFCLSVNVDQPGPMISPDDIAINPDRGELTLGFGAFRTSLFRDKAAAVHFLQALLGEWVAGTVGLLLALIWTAGFIPTFLEPSVATVLLTKPVPRWLLLVGKVLGVLVFVTFQAAIFVLGTWVALGIRTGEWDPRYLSSLPILVVQFTIIYSMSVLIGVWTRSTVACVFGSILFWLLCYGMNYACHATMTLPDETTPTLHALSTLGYWVLPKPADLGVILHGALDAGKHFTLPDVLASASVNPLAAIASSLGCAILLLAAATYELKRLDY